MVHWLIIVRCFSGRQRESKEMLHQKNQKKQHRTRKWPFLQTNTGGRDCRIHHTHLFFHHLMIVIKALRVGVLQWALAEFIIVIYNFIPWWKIFTYKKTSYANGKISGQSRFSCKAWLFYSQKVLHLPIKYATGEKSTIIHRWQGEFYLCLNYLLQLLVWCPLAIPDLQLTSSKCTTVITATFFWERNAIRIFFTVVLDLLCVTLCAFGKFAIMTVN